MAIGQSFADCTRSYSSVSSTGRHRNPQQKQRLPLHSITSLPNLDGMEPWNFPDAASMGHLQFRNQQSHCEASAKEPWKVTACASMHLSAHRWLCALAVLMWCSNVKRKS